MRKRRNSAHLQLAMALVPQAIGRARISVVARLSGRSIYSGALSQGKSRTYT